jgi:hypothetical protein
LNKNLFSKIDKSRVIEWPKIDNVEEAKQLGFEKVPFTKINYNFKMIAVNIKDTDTN